MLLETRLYKFWDDEKMTNNLLSKNRIFTITSLTLTVLLIQLFLIPNFLNAATNSFVITSNGHFYLEGKPFRFVGVNSSFLYRYELNDYQKAINPTRAEQLISEAAKNGIRVMRIFAMGDTQIDGRRAYDNKTDEQPLQKGPNNWQEENFKAVDRVMNYAGLYNIKLILVVTNMHHDYGGIGEYVAWAGYNATTERGKFYVDPVIKNYYKNMLNKWANRINTVNGIRYRDDPTILAWDLISEPYGTTTANLESWTDEMASYVKSQDPNHLVTFGNFGQYDENYPNGSSDFRIALTSRNIDFATWHVYLRDKSGPSLPYFAPGVAGPLSEDQFKSEVQRRAIDANAANKPFIIDEFGIRQKEINRSYWMKIGFDYILDYGGSGVIYWQWIPDAELKWHDNYKISPSQTEYTSILANAANKASSSLNDSSNNIGEIIGKVVGPFGNPIPGTIIRIDNSTMTTNSEGKFKFTLVYPGIYVIHYYAPGYIRQIQIFPVLAGTENHPPTVILSPALNSKATSFLNKNRTRKRN